MNFMMLRVVVCALTMVMVVGPAMADKLIVLDARGGGLKAGMSIDSSANVTLKEGERVTVIGPKGNSVVLKGPFNGPALTKSDAGMDAKQALSALVATRDARSTAVGVIRAGTDAVKIPEPWLIDVTRPGPRCLLEGELPVWWRPDASKAQHFTLYPIDRSWKADIAWELGQDRQTALALSRFAGANVFFIRQDDQEFAISLNVIPKSVDSDLVLSAWMLEKGCLQQADALLAGLRTELQKSK
jgi:hypothetical protein